MDFFDQPILNSPYSYPNQHWELDETGQPTQSVNESRRPSSLITPVPKPQSRNRGRSGGDAQMDMVLDAEMTYLMKHRNIMSHDTLMRSENMWTSGAFQMNAIGR